MLGPLTNDEIKWFGRNRSWYNRGPDPAFAWRDSHRQHQQSGWLMFRPRLQPKISEIQLQFVYCKPQISLTALNNFSRFVRFEYFNIQKLVCSPRLTIVIDLKSHQAQISLLLVNYLHTWTKRTHTRCYLSSRGRHNEVKGNMESIGRMFFCIV